MRFAFIPTEIEPNHVNVDLFDAASINEGAATPLVTVVFFRKDAKSKWYVVRTCFNMICCKPDITVMVNLVKLNTAACSLTGAITPFSFCRALQEARASQAVFDNATKHYRNVTTMTAGKDSWKVVGTDIVVEAEDEAAAVRLAKREVTEQMQEKPEAAAKLVSFFTEGCKVEKIAGAALPPYMKVADLACNQDEVKLAKTPIAKKAEKSDKAE